MTICRSWLSGLDSVVERCIGMGIAGIPLNRGNLAGMEAMLRGSRGVGKMLRGSHWDEQNRAGFPPGCSSI